MSPLTPITHIMPMCGRPLFMVMPVIRRSRCVGAVFAAWSWSAWVRASVWTTTAGA